MVKKRDRNRKRNSHGGSGSQGRASPTDALVSKSPHWPNFWIQVVGGSIAGVIVLAATLNWETKIEPVSVGKEQRIAAPKIRMVAQDISPEGRTSLMEAIILVTNVGLKPGAIHSCEPRASGVLRTPKVTMTSVDPRSIYFHQRYEAVLTYRVFNPRSDWTYDSQYQIVCVNADGSLISSIYALEDVRGNGSFR